MPSTGFSVAEVTGKLDFLKSLHSTRDTWFDQADAIFKLDHSTAFGFGPIVSDDDLRHNISTPVRRVRQVLGMLVGNGLRISAYPMRDNRTNRQKAGDIERFLYGVLQDSERRHGAVLTRTFTNGLVRGWGSWFVGWDVNREKSKQDLGNPIVWKPIDPKFLFYEPGGVPERFQSVMYSFNRRRADVEREWDTVITAASSGPHDSSKEEVEYTDYWWYEHAGAEWEVWHAVLSAGQVLKDATKMSPYYDRLPYITWFCQPGPYAGPEDWGRGALYDLREVIKTRERVMDRLLHRLALAADGVVNIVQTQAQAEDIGDWQYEKTSGTVNYLPRGWEPRSLPIEPIPPEAAAILNELHSEELVTGLSGPPSGAPPGASTNLPGVTYHAMTDAASQWLATDTQSLATALQSCFQLVSNLCLNYATGSTVSVFAKKPGPSAKGPAPVSLKGDDFEGFYIDVDIDTSTDSDRIRRQTLGMQLLNLPPEARPFAVREIAERHFDNEDYERTKRFKLDELVESMPAIQEALAREAAAAEGLPIEYLGPQQPPPPSNPQTPPSPPQGQAGSPVAGLPPTIATPQMMAGSPAAMPAVPMPAPQPNAGPEMQPGPVPLGALPILPGQ